MDDSTFSANAAVDCGSETVAAQEASVAVCSADEGVQSYEGGNTVQETVDEGAADAPASAAAGGQLSEADADQPIADQPPAGDAPMTDASEGADGGAPASNPEEDTRKLFVGGLAPESTREDVQRYFSQFGDVAQCIVKTDVFTGRSRGFGFVVFKEPAAVEKTLALSLHELHGKYIDPKRANPKIGKAKEPVLKVFVGGIDPSSTREELIEYFTKFGPVVSMDLPTLKKTEERRGFIFVTFETEEAVSTCCEAPRQTILGRECDVKRATPKQEYQKQQQTAERGGGATGSYGYARGSRGASARGGDSGRGSSYYHHQAPSGGGTGSYRGGRGGYSAGYGGYAPTSGYGGPRGGGGGYGSAAAGYGGPANSGYAGGPSSGYAGGAGYGSTGNSYGAYQYGGGQAYNGSGYDGYAGAAGGSGGNGYGGSYQGGSADYGGFGAGKIRARPRGASSNSYGYQPY